MEVLEDYDFQIQYTPGTCNKVADALSQKYQAVVSMMVVEWNDLKLLSFSCDVWFGSLENTLSRISENMEARPSIIQRTQTRQKDDPMLVDRIPDCKIVIKLKI